MKNLTILVLIGCIAIGTTVTTAFFLPSSVTTLKPINFTSIYELKAVTDKGHLALVPISPKEFLDQKFNEK